MSEHANEEEPDVPDYEGPAETLPDYDPAEAEESSESGEGEV